MCPVESQRLLLRVAEAAELLGISRAKGYELAASGEIPVVRIGRATRIPLDALRRWIADAAESQTAPPPTGRGPR
jgi:excisionase family DNA binding protein